MRRKTNQKIDFKKALTRSIIGAGTGAVAQVIDKAIDLQNPEHLDYTLIGAGIVLPEFIKKEEMEIVGSSLTAIGAYRLAERKELADKLGFGKKASATAGLPDDFVIGAVNDWKAEDIYTDQTTKKNTKNKQSTVL